MEDVVDEVDLRFHPSHASHEIANRLPTCLHTVYARFELFGLPLNATLFIFLA